MSVAEADEATTFGGFVDGGLEHPEILCRASEPQDRLGVNPVTSTPLGQSQEITVCRITNTVDSNPEAGICPRLGTLFHVPPAPYHDIFKRHPRSSLG